MRREVQIEPAEIYINRVRPEPIYKKPVLQPQPVIIEPAKVYPQPEPEEPRIFKVVPKPEPVIIEPAKVYPQPEPEEPRIFKVVPKPEPVIIEPAKVYPQPEPEPPQIINDSNTTEDMTAFKKTVLGKILGGAAKVFIPIAAAVTGIGAISGAAKGIGAIAGVKNIFGGAAKGIDVVATKAGDLVTGLTQEQRKALRAEKQEASDAKDKIDFAEKLQKAGASKEESYIKAGIPTEELSGGLVAKQSGIGTYILFGAGILGLIALLAKLGKKR